MYLQSNDQAQYERVCLELIRRFGNTDQVHIAERVSKIALLLPSSGVDATTPLQLADFSVANSKGSAALCWYQLAKGIAEYRRQHYEDAQVWLKRSLDTAGKTAAYCRALDHLFLAMSKHQLNDRTAATQSLEMADQILKAHPDPGNAWNDWIMANVVRREATELLKNTD